MKWYKQFPDNHPAISMAIEAFGWEGKGIMDKLTQLVQENGPFILTETVLCRNFGFNARKSTRIFPTISKCFANLLRCFPKDSNVSECLPKFDNVSECLPKLDAQNPHGSTRDQEKNREEEKREETTTTFPPPEEKKASGGGIFFEINLRGLEMREDEWIVACLQEERKSKNKSVMGFENLTSVQSLYPVYSDRIRQWLRVPIARRIAAFAFIAVHKKAENQFSYALKAAQDGESWEGMSGFIRKAEESVSREDYRVNING